MPLIPDDEIERLKRETDLAAVIRSRGIALKPQGADLVGLCPFHPDKNPSLHVTPAKRLWRCMSCGATGNVFQFVQRFDGISFPHACDLLRDGAAAYKAAPTCGPVKKSTAPRLANPLTGVAAAGGDAAAERAADQEALRRVVDYYHERLAVNASAWAYLEKRGLDDPGLIAAFRLGFCDRTLGLRIPNKQRVEGAALRARLEKLGVYNAVTGHEFFRGRIVVPVLAENGEVGTIYGRAIGKVEKGDRHRFLPGPQSGVFNPSALKPETLAAHGGMVILTEGILDALTWWVHGWRNVTTCYSARQPSSDVLDAIVQAGVRVACLAFNPDGAGDTGTASAAALLMARGVECRRVRFPRGHDANSYALAVTPSAKSLGVLLNAAEWLGQGRAVGPAPADAAASGLRGVVAAASSDDASPVAPAPSSLAASGSAAEPSSEHRVAGSEHTPSEASAVQPFSSSAFAPQAQEAAGEKIRVTSVTASGVTHVSLTRRGEHWCLDLNDPVREYRVGGVEKTLGTDALKVALRLRVGDRFHLDTVDLAKDGERRRFIERAAEETGLHVDLLRRDVARLLLAVETAQAELARPAEAVAPAVVLSPEERAAALAWAQAPDLIGRLRAALRRVLVGEDANALVLYLICTSRLLDRPLAGIVQSPSAAGKTTLMDAALSFFPEEDRVKYSAMTGQSLFYMGDADLRHKILAIVEEAGAEKAAYALKLLQSEGELTIASTGKNPQTGRMETQEYHVEGPVAIVLTTTSADLDEELQNRCLTLAVDDSPEQTARIHTLQRERRTLAGLVAKAERAAVLGLLRNVQRLLRPLDVLNPFAPALTFVNGRARNRRDHEKYLTLIDAIALLHQRPRGRHEVAGRVLEYVQVTLDDIALANELAPEVLGRSLDELPPQTRRLLDHVKALVRSKREGSAPAAPGRGAAPAPGNGAPPAAPRHSAFSRRELREACGWSLTQVRVHLERLVELEYLELRHGKLGGGFVYELMIDPDAPAHVAHIGLIDVAELRKKYGYDGKVAGFGPGVADQNGPVAGGGATPPPPPKPDAARGETAP